MSGRLTQGLSLVLLSALAAAGSAHAQDAFGGGGTCVICSEPSAVYRCRIAEQDRIEARMQARPDMGNGVGILHGGAYMAFADFLGALGTVVNLPNGAATTTMESKTNFFAPAREGTMVIGVSTPLHKGRRTMVWQTRLSNPEGRLLAMITQTQMVLEKRD